MAINPIPRKLKMVKQKKVDACVIGSGAGGGVMAKELAEQGMSVVVLEAGHRFIPEEDYIDTTTFEWERGHNRRRKSFNTTTMGDYVNAGKYPTRFNRAFGVGGTTLRYMGYAIRLLPDDFRVYTLDGVADDWPISYEDLAPYYRKVELTLGVSGLHGNPWAPATEPYPNPPFEFSYANKILKRGCDKMGIRLWPVPRAQLSRTTDGRSACVGAGVCTRGCIHGAKSSIDVTYIPLAEKTGRVEIRANSIALHIECNDQGRAKRVIYADHDGNRYTQEADVIVLAAGTIHSPRLLLASASTMFPDGLSNSSGLVGKRLMDHSGVEVNASFHDRIDAFRGIPGGAISMDFSRTSKNNNFTRGWLLQLHGGEFDGPISAAFNTPGWGSEHKKAIGKVFGHRAGIRPNCEQLPDERNKVELDSTKVDYYGIPLPRITSEARENDLKVQAAAKKQLIEICEASGAYEIFSEPNRAMFNSHPVGTCRMGNDPDTSVINSFCQSHDVPNLFITDGSCFVTMGTSNPSLTIQAIATRTAEYIIRETKRKNI